MKAVGHSSLPALAAANPFSDEASACYSLNTAGNAASKTSKTSLFDHVSSFFNVFKLKFVTN